MYLEIIYNQNYIQVIKIARPKKDITAALALVAKDLLKSNQSVADIGIIVGALGTDSLKWLEELKAECTDIDEFIEIAKQRADISLIAAATKEAMGYEYKETEQNYLKVPDGYNPDGSPKMKDMPGNKKVRRKIARPNDALLRFILRCRLPEYFSDVQKVEINKKVIEIKDITRKEIEDCGRKLIQALDVENTN